MAPELACVSWATPGLSPQVTDRFEGVKAAERWLRSPNTLLIGAHVAYDFAVLCADQPQLVPLVFEAYDADRVTDVQIRQKLLDIAGGCYRGRTNSHGFFNPYRYDLDSLVRRHTGRNLEKMFHRECFEELHGVPMLRGRSMDVITKCEKKTACSHCRLPIESGSDTASWRLAYGQLRDIPVSEWPPGAVEYPKDDALGTLETFLQQEVHVSSIPDQFHQARAAFALHLTATWGLRTSPAGVESITNATKVDFERLKQRLLEVKLVRPDGTRDTKAAKERMLSACQELNRPPRVTKTGGISLDSDACEASEDPVLEDYAKFSGFTYVWSKDIPALTSGIRYPIHTRFDIAETGRCTSSGPNVQNWRRLPGVRECFVPREGWVFIQSDYDQLELRTLAQVCVILFGYSALAQVLNAGRDPHTELACNILGISTIEGYALRESEDKAFDDARQTAKVANFGFPGGLGAEKLCLFARKTYSVVITPADARILKSQWLVCWPEMREYFAYINQITDSVVGAVVTHLFTQRIRGGASYTAACNSHFQGLGADAAKRALWLVQRACYAESWSPLYGSRSVNFIHDEIINETRDHEPELAHAANELARLMILGANEMLPDCPATTTPLAMRFWSKAASDVYHPVTGLLVPWEGACQVLIKKKDKLKPCDKPAWFHEEGTGKFICTKCSSSHRVTPIRADGVIGVTEKVAAA